MGTKFTAVMLMIPVALIGSANCAWSQGQAAESQPELRAVAKKAPSRAVSFISKAPFQKETPQLAPPMTPKLAPEIPKAGAAKAPAANDAGAAVKTAPPPQAAAPAQAPVSDRFPQIGNLENVCFGQACPTLELNSRINHLESIVFRQTYPNLSVKERTHRLQETLLGRIVEDEDLPLSQRENPPVERQATTQPEQRIPPAYQPPPEPRQPTEEEMADRFLATPEYQAIHPQASLEHYALEAVNEARADRNVPPLAWDELAFKVAQKQVQDMTARGEISHFDKAGENPDKRYTDVGGTDAITEGIVQLPDASTHKMNKAMIVRMFRLMTKSQDDRDSLLAPEATELGFSFAKDASRDRYLGVVCVVTKHGIMHPIEKEVSLGEKIDVRGVILAPYKFKKITLAWEGFPEGGQNNSDEAEEALPYFAPLDFVAYANKSEHDYEKAGSILRTAGVVAAIAGGMIIPPVALAAPLIAMSGGATDDMKPVSEIPVRGGIKLEGSIFNGKIPISNDGKAGLYYITVWASTQSNIKPVAISRRVVIAKSTGAVSEAEPDNKEKSDKSDKAKKHKRDKKGHDQ
jgi:uncharacterized protein YkwD